MLPPLDLQQKNIFSPPFYFAMTLQSYIRRDKQMPRNEIKSFISALQFILDLSSLELEP